ncbi:MAG: glutathione S-transferase family protein [Polyangiaceae bacterium]|nr:glutathione S-transferase family protein [Polyangiaceae bacterium]
MTSAIRVHWALEELGVPYEKVRIDFEAGDQKKPEFLALNPNGKVPLLVAEGEPIFESLAILLYLGERFGVDKGLFPTPSPTRAVAFKWMAWSTVTLGEAVTRYLRNTADRFPAEERNAKAAETAKSDIQAALGILDKELADKPYVLGDSFSLVDVSLAALVPFLARVGIETGAFTNINAWVGRCMSRPALGRAMMG